MTCQVLKNGVEVKLQRNALSVLEHPTGHEEDDDHDYDISSSSSDIGEKDNDFCKLQPSMMIFGHMVFAFNSFRKVKKVFCFFIF